MKDNEFEPLIAFHASLEKKQFYINRMKLHIEADRLVQGFGYWAIDNFHGCDPVYRGCAIGCILEPYESEISTDSSALSSYLYLKTKEELGIPYMIAALVDVLFESMSEKDAAVFPLAFLESIPVGVNLSLVFYQLIIWMFDNEEGGAIWRAKDLRLIQFMRQLVDRFRFGIAGENKQPNGWRNVANQFVRNHKCPSMDSLDTPSDKYLLDFCWTLVSLCNHPEQDTNVVLGEVFRAYFSWQHSAAGYKIIANKLLELIRNTDRYYGV